MLASVVEAEYVHCSYKAKGYTELAEEDGGGVVLHFEVRSYRKLLYLCGIGKSCQLGKNA